jgi:hypothetical protein
MKRWFSFALLLALLLGAAVPAAASTPAGLDQDGDPQPKPPSAGGSIIFLPMVRAANQSYTVTGQVKNAQDLPLAGVTVRDDAGHSAITDSNGVYRLAVNAGQRLLVPSNSAQRTQAPATTGYTFEPASAQVNVTQNLDGQDFTALLACENVVPNPGFETVPFYWNPISGNANGYTPYYTSEKANTGSYSGFTGIRDVQPNTSSWSRFRTHNITIPSTASDASLTLALWPKSTDPTFKPQPIAPQQTGFDTEAPDAPQLYDDAQYVAVLDSNNNVLAWVLWTRLNDQAWVTTPTISLMAWRGRTIKLEIGTYNDGYGGVTSTYVDDVNLSLCPGGAPGTCTNSLLNSNMEADDGWIARPANIPSTYTTEYSYSPSYSARNGIPLWAANPYPYVFTTSEFYQPVSIPAAAYYARLRMRLLPRGAYYSGYYSAAEAQPSASLAPALDTGSQYDPQALAAAEAQYGFIMDSSGTSDLKMLFKWYSLNSAYWLYREYDLTAYRGQTISVLFGAANDGWGTNTSLYVDDVYLEVCQ